MAWAWQARERAPESGGIKTVRCTRMKQKPLKNGGKRMWWIDQAKKRIDVLRLTIKYWLAGDNWDVAKASAERIMYWS